MLTKKEKIFYYFLADSIFIIHLFFVLFLALGWLVPQFFTAFVVLWALTLASEIIFGGCILTDIEFAIRKKIEPNRRFEKSFVSYYTRILFGLKPREEIKNKNFLQKNAFKLSLLILLGMAIVYNYFIVELLKRILIT